MTKDELKKHIDWLVGTLPPFPPPWATKALSELIERHKELDTIEAAVLAEREACAKVCEDYPGTLHQWTDKRKTFAAAIRARSTNSCQKSTKLVEIPQKLHRAGIFGD